MKRGQRKRGQRKPWSLIRGRAGGFAAAARWLGILAGFAILAGAGGCKRQAEEIRTGSKAETAAVETAGWMAMTDEQLTQQIGEVLHGLQASDYVSVSVPETIRLQVLTDTVTEEELEAYVQSFLAGFAFWEQITDRETREGDVVALSYDVFLDGELVESRGSDVAPVLVQLEESEDETDLLARLIGQSCGEEIRFSLPDPASAGGENGENRQEGGAAAAQVTAMIYWIQGDCTVPQLEEAWISSLSGYEDSSVEELVEDLRQELAAYKKNRSEYYKQIDLWYQLSRNAQWTGYPEVMLEQYRRQEERDYQQHADWYGFASPEEYREEVLRMTEEELGRYLEDMAREHCQEELLILYLMQEKPELLPDAGQCREWMAAYAYTYGYGEEWQAEDGQKTGPEWEAVWKKGILAVARENILSYLESIAEVTLVDSFEAEGAE